MRRGRGVWAVAAALASVASGACGAILGFDDIERVDAAHDAAAPSPEGDGAADAATATMDADANVDVDAGRATTACPAAPPTSVPPWVSPPARPKPCTSDDIATFVNNESRSFEAQRTAMAAKNAACAACVFTTENDPVWGPITHTNDDRIFVDYGLCYRTAGASDSCGATAHDLEWCIQKVCNVCTAGQSLSECRQAAEKSSVCKPTAEAVLAACAGSEQILGTSCGRSGNVVGVLCGGV